MSWFKRASSSFSIGFGLLFIIVGIHSFNDRDLHRHERLNEGTSLLLMGTLFAGAGAWTKQSLRLQKQQQERDRLRSVLYELLWQTETLTVLQFAMTANVAGDVAKQFLEQQAQIFGADYDVSDRGELTYRFRSTPLVPIALPSQTSVDASMTQTAPADAPTTASTEMFDVVLSACPAKQKISIIKAVRDLTGRSLKGAKYLVDAVPQPVMQNIPRDLAESYVQRLERAGAIVTLKSHQK